MSKIKAIIVGVSNYSIKGARDLPFCRNDIIAIKDAFIRGLNVFPEDIIVCGLSGSVTLNAFESSLQAFSNDTSEDDILLFYFSGHGANISSNHYLVLTDDLINTQTIISNFDAISAKSKVMFLDCCHAGNFEVSGVANIDIDATVDSFAGKGYAVFASSNALQSSYPHPDNQTSLFTRFLCDALTSRFIIREGKKSLHDIHKLLSLMMETWNKNHPSMSQKTIFRANMGGTIFFNVEDYHPYATERFFFDSDTYTIRSVEPIHTSLAKRYSVKILLKVPMSFSDIATINHQIVDRVKRLNIFSGPAFEKQWRNKPANLIVCCFGLSETDLINCNYICNTTWVDETQDKKLWYKTGKNYETIDEICFFINPYYDFSKQFTAEHTASKDELIAETKEIVYRMISFAEHIIATYNSYLNDEKGETELIDAIKIIAPEIDMLYLRETNLDIPPNDIAEWCKQCSFIAGCIHDLSLYYSRQAFLERSPENRRACMDIAIKQYYKDLEVLRKMSAEL